MPSLYLECLARIVPPRAIRSSLIFTSLLRCIVLLICVVLPGSASAQVHRDRTALSAIAGSIARFGGLPPVDSVAVAKVTVTSGTSTQVGTMRIVTRGMDETREEIKLKGTSESLVFSKGSSSEKRKSTKPGKDPYSFELSLTAQSPLFPLPWLASRYANNDTAIEDLGAETSDGTVSSHLRLTNTFTSNPMLKHYAPFTASDLWLDAGLGLLRKISYERREAGGSTRVHRIFRLSQCTGPAVPVPDSKIHKRHSVGGYFHPECHL